MKLQEGVGLGACEGKHPLLAAIPFKQFHSRNRYKGIQAGYPYCM